MQQCVKNKFPSANANYKKMQEKEAASKKKARVVEFPAEKKVSAVITISEADTSPERAIQSIIENSKFFEDVHIVKFGYSTNAELYDGWSDDLEVNNIFLFFSLTQKDSDQTGIGTCLAFRVGRQQIKNTSCHENRA